MPTSERMYVGWGLNGGDRDYEPECLATAEDQQLAATLREVRGFLGLWPSRPRGGPAIKAAELI
jgi:hypothetical protein